MRPSLFYSGLFLVTASALMLQLLQTRILSVMAWYHLAFFAISMAMFGLTAGAVFVYVRKEFTAKTLSKDLSYYSMAFAISIVVCLILQMSLVPVAVQSLIWVFVWIQIALCVAVPFFFSGVVVSLALTRSTFPIGKVYGVDLFGAALGCLFVLFLLNKTDGPSAVLWVAAVAVLASILFENAEEETGVESRMLASLFKRKKTLLVGASLLATFNGLTSFGIQPMSVKGVFEGGNSHIYRQWNTFSRVAVFKEQFDKPFMWGFSERAPTNTGKLWQRALQIDGDAGTVAYKYNGDLQRYEFLRADVTNLAFFLPDRSKVAVVGVGGGRDILSAAVMGMTDITGIEVNPTFVELLTTEPGFSDFTNLDMIPGVKLVVDEGRSWLSNTDERFDVIQMTLVDTWAATGSGAFTLTENGLYTVEAWDAFLGALAEGGVFTVSRWFDPEVINETDRLASLAIAVLQRRGVVEPQQHLYLVTQRNIATLLVSSSPFSEADLSHLNFAVEFMGHNTLLNPLVEPSSQDLRRMLMAENLHELEQATLSSEFDVSAPTDNRPFFFNQLRFDQPLEVVRAALEMLQSEDGSQGVRHGNLVATLTLIVLLLISAILVLLTIVVPLRGAIRHTGRRLVIGGTFYFFLVGFGFMLVEMAFLQRASVFLGHPVYALSVLLFTLILTTGVGSLASSRYPIRGFTTFTVWGIATGMYIVIASLATPVLFSDYQAVALAHKVALAIAMIAPAGLLMGYAFPTGMEQVTKLDSRPTPWFWGINGAAGVLASVVAIILSMAHGISFTLFLGALCYLLLVPVGLYAFFDSREQGS